MNKLPIACLMCVCLPILHGGEPHRNLKFRKSAQMDVLISIRLLRDETFGLAVFNTSKESVLFGELHSALGFDQFQLKVESFAGAIDIRRKKDLFFTRDTRQPLVIPPGSHHEFVVNVTDGTWDIAKPDVSSWKTIKVLYEPKGCALIDARRDKRVFDMRLESPCVEINSSEGK